MTKEERMNEAWEAYWKSTQAAVAEYEKTEQTAAMELKRKLKEIDNESDS